MADKATLHQLIEGLHEAGLLTAERFLAYRRQQEIDRSLARIVHERPLYDSDFYQLDQVLDSNFLPEA